MDNAENFQDRTTDNDSLVRKAAARVKAILLTLTLALGAFWTPTAASLIVNTDSSWLATNAAPAATWNSDPSFDTSGWTNAVVSIPACNSGADCIWYDGQFSGTQFAWMRKSFTISGPISAAFLIGAIDDDGDIYVNGTQVLNNHTGFAENFGPIDVTALLVQGVNLIAVAAEDNFPVFGQNHAFVASLRIAQVPEPASLLLLAFGLAGLGFARRRKQ